MRETTTRARERRERNGGKGDGENNVSTTMRRGLRRKWANDSAAAVDSSKTSSWRRVWPGCVPVPRDIGKRRECRADVSRSAGAGRPPVVGGVRNCGSRCLRALPAEGTAVWPTPGWWWFGGTPGGSSPGGLVTGQRMREHPGPPATNISSNGDAGRRSPGYVLAVGAQCQPFLSCREM